MKHNVIVIFLIFLSSLYSAPVEYKNVVLDDSPVAFWRLSESSGNTLVDASSSEHNGTYYGPTLNQEGVSGGDSSALFDGVNDYAIVNDSADFNFLNYTLEAWIKIEGSATSHRRIISQQDSEYWLLHINDNKLTMYSSLDGTNNLRFGPDLNDGEWHHVVSTRDTVNNLMIVWVDGVAVGTQTTTSDVAYNIAGNIEIGTYRAGQQFFPGYIDEIALYNTALSEEQIGLHYAAGLGTLPLGSIPEPQSILLALLGIYIVIIELT